MLGPGLSGLLLDPAHPGWFRLRPDLLSGGHRVSGAGRGRQHDPGVEHTDHPEPVRHQVLLAGHQVQGHSGKLSEFVSVKSELSEPELQDPTNLLLWEQSSPVICGVGPIKRAGFKGWLFHKVGTEFF